MATTLTLLEAYFIHHAVDQHKGMDALQDAGVISDHCVNPEDVALKDIANAIAFLDVWTFH